jgi:hypothetical protein
VSDLNDLIHTNARNAYEQGLERGKRLERDRIFAAMRLVSYEDRHDNQVVAIADLEFELDSPSPLLPKEQSERQRIVTLIKEIPEEFMPCDELDRAVAVLLKRIEQ